MYLICNQNRGLPSPLYSPEGRGWRSVLPHPPHQTISLPAAVSKLLSLFFPSQPFPCFTLKHRIIVFIIADVKLRSPSEVSVCVSPQPPLPPSTSPPQTPLYKIPFYLLLVCFLLGGGADPSRSLPFDVRCSLVTDYNSHLQKERKEGRQVVKKKRAGCCRLCRWDHVYLPSSISCFSMAPSQSTP